MSTTIKKNKLNCLYLMLAFTLIFGACKSSTKEANKTPDKHIDEKQKSEIKEESDKDVELTKEQMKAVGIELGKIELKNLSSVVKANGQLEVPPQNKADVTSLIGGVIKKINVLEGNYVKKGQTVAMIENPEFIKLQQEYLSILRGSTYAAQEFTRQKELKEADAGTGKIYQQAESNLMVERARVKGLATQLKQFGINPESVSKGNIVTQLPVRSPISGGVGHIKINIGAYIDATSSLMEVIDNSQIHCDLEVFEKDLFKVKIGQEINFILTNQDNRQITGHIYGINKSFESENKAVVVHAVINDSGRNKLIPGMYVSALIKVGSEQVFAVPIDAVVKSESKEYIFIVDEKIESTKDEKAKKKAQPEEDKTAFKMIEVIIGVSELGYIQITTLDKIPDDAKVVTKDAFYILSKARGSAEEEK